jgi:hypothetical protein
MKNNAKPILGYLSIAAMLTIFLFSCKKNTTDPPGIDSQKQGTVYEYIKKLGYKDDEIKDIGERYLVDGDILFHKNSQPDLSVFDGPQTEQYGSGNYVGYNEQPNIVIYLDPSVQNFETEINAGVAMLNNIPNCRINLTTTLSPTDRDITITSAVLGTNCGQGSYPMNGRAGQEIFINTAMASGYSLNQWKNLIGHLIGHSIGLRHTNWVARSESQQFTDPLGAHVNAMHILGTPTGEDPLSIMNDGLCGSDTELSNYDILAIQTIYPEAPPAPSGTVPVFRYYNGHEFQDHFYTRNYSELGDGSNDGYHFEGIAFYAFKTQVANSVPVTRWFNSTTGNHYYTTDPTEIPPGSVNQGVAFYAYPSAINNALPVQRYYNASFDDHFYTKNENEIALMTGYSLADADSWYAY